MSNNTNSLSIQSGVLLTSTTSTASALSTYASYGTFVSPFVFANTKTTYYILGEEFDSGGYVDINLSIIISTLNVLGKPFWEDVIKQGITFDPKMFEFIEKRFKILDRDKKINEVIDEG